MYAMPQQHHQIEPSKKRRIKNALQALKREATLSQPRAAAIFNVPRKALSDQCAGQPLGADCEPRSMNLTKLGKSVIINHIFELVARGFPPRPAAVADMANYFSRRAIWAILA